MKTKGSLTGMGLLVASVLLAAPPAHAQDTDVCISASEAAVSQRKADKLIDSRRSLAVCAASACPDAVRASCQTRLAEMSRAIPSVIFYAKDASGHDVASVMLTIDGAAHPAPLDGAALTLDPGPHEFRFESAGQPPVVLRFVLHQGEQGRRETVVIGVTAAPEAAGVVPLAADSPSSASTLRTAGLVVGGVGAASLLAGAIFGGLSIGAHSSYEKSCGSNIGAPAGQCNQTGVSGESDAATKGTLSTVFFIGGGALLAAGATMFFLAPKRAGAPQVGVGPGSFVVKGQF